MPSTEDRRVARLTTHLAAGKITQDGGMTTGNRFHAASTEAELRVELAAAYRIVAMLGWDDGIQNHLTVSIPGRANEYLINSQVRLSAATSGLSRGSTGLSTRYLLRYTSC